MTIAPLNNHTLNVLLVEDHPQFAATMQAQLRLLPQTRWFQNSTINATLAGSLSAALKAYHAARPHLILLDVNLPDSSGLATAKAFLSLPNPPPIIIVSAVTESDTVTTALELGVSDYLIKGEFDFHYLAHVINITLERKYLHEELLARESNLIQIFNASPNGVIVTDHENIIQFANPMAIELLTQSDEVLIGQSIPFDINHTKPTYTTTPNQRELEITITPLQWNNAPAQLVTLHDITAERAAQAQVAIQNHALSAAANAILILDINGTIEWANQAASETTGYPLDELIGQSSSIFVSGVHDAGFYEMVWQTAYSGQVWRGEMVNRRKNGALYFEEVTITPIKNETGEITRFVVVNQDISQRKLTEEEINRRNTELSLLNSVLSFANTEQDFTKVATFACESLQTALNLDVSSALKFDALNQGHHVIYMDPETTAQVDFGVSAFIKLEPNPMNDQLMQATRPIAVNIELALGRFSPAVQEFILSLRLKNLVLAPLNSQGIYLGALALGSHTLRTFSTYDLNLIGNIATAVAQSTYNQQLFDRERDQRLRAEVFFKATSAFNRTLDPNDVIVQIVNEVHSMMKCDSVAVMVKTHDNLYVMAAIPEFLEPIELSNLPLVQEVIDSGRPLVIRDVRKEPRWTSFSERSQIRSWLGVPIIAQGDVIGVLNVDRNTPGNFDPDEIAALQVLTTHAAVSLLNARLHQQTTQRVRYLNALRLFETRAAAKIELNTMLTLLADLVQEQLGVDALILRRPITEPNGTLVYRAALRIGFRTAALGNHTLKTDGPILQFVGTNTHPLYLADLTDTTHITLPYAKHPEFQREGFVSYVVITLATKGKILGVLELFHRSPLRPDTEWFEFLSTLAGQAAIAIHNALLLTDLQDANLRMRRAYNATLEGWVQALDLRDHETEGHAQRVTMLTVRLAERLGFGGEDLEHIRRGALLHDIGKMAVPDAILQKPGPLTEEEWAIMRQHPHYAYQWLKDIEYLQPALAIPHYHHERWDGSGYPHGLSGDAIPMAARIFAVVDVWDALTNNRPYRQAWTVEKTLVYMHEQSGKHFDPAVVTAFAEMIGADQINALPPLILASQSADLISIVKQALQTEYNLFVVGTGEAALWLLQQQDIPLLLLDQTLHPYPTLLLENLRTVRPKLRSLLLTTTLEVDFLIEAINHRTIQGAIHHPWPQKTLQQQVAAVYTRAKSDIATNQSTLLAAASSTSMLTLLIIDNEAALLRALTRSLSKSYIVLTATSPQEAYALMHENTVHIILCDQRMPHELGSDFLAAINESHPNIRAVLMTGYMDNDALLAAINLPNITAFVQKPWNLKTLQAHLEQAALEHLLA